MNWKRIGRFLVCLALICVFLVNSSPIRAEATGAGLAATWAAFAVAPEIAISAAMIALGVTVVAGSAAVLGGVVSECEQFLVENGYISGDLVDVYRADADSRIQYMISRELVEVIRDWLFDSGTLSTKVVISGAEATTSALCSSDHRFSYSSFWRVDMFDTTSGPSNMLALFKGLGVNDKVFIYGCSKEYLYGTYFNSAGQSCCATFTNNLGALNASVIGTHPLSTLNMVSELNTSMCFYSESYALAHPDYLTSDVFVFDWTREPYKTSTGALSDDVFFRAFYKSSEETKLSSTSSSRCFVSYYSSGMYSDTCKHFSRIEWDTTSLSSVSTDLDLNVSGVASPDKSFSDGYSEWASGAKSLPTLRNGEISDAESMYLSLGMADTLEETMALIQSQAQGGSITGSGTASDTVGSTKVDLFFEGLQSILWAPIEWLGDMLLSGIEALFVPSEDYLTAKVDALRSEFAFADSIIDTFNLFSGSFLDFDTSPPVITIDLGAAEGSYFFGNETVFIDLSWYSRYKPTVDALLSAFMWLVFLWRVGIHLPNIVSGSSGSVPGGIVPANSETRLTVQR